MEGGNGEATASQLRFLSTIENNGFIKKWKAVTEKRQLRSYASPEPPITFVIKVFASITYRLH